MLEIEPVIHPVFNAHGFTNKSLFDYAEENSEFIYLDNTDDFTEYTAALQHLNLGCDQTTAYIQNSDTLFKVTFDYSISIRYLNGFLTRISHNQYSINDNNCNRLFDILADAAQTRLLVLNVDEFRPRFMVAQTTAIRKIYDRQIMNISTLLYNYSI